MAQTLIQSDGLASGCITRSKLNTTLAASAVIAKLIAGFGHTITNTGVDAGTGDVTVKLDQTCAPTWTGSHTWTVAGATCLTANVSGSGTGLFANNSGSGQGINVYNTGSGSGIYVNAPSGTAINVIAGSTYLQALSAAGPISTGVSASLAWQFDFTGNYTNTNNITLTNGQTVALPAGSGVVYLAEMYTGLGFAVCYPIYGTVNVNNISGALYSGAAGTAGKVNLYYSTSPAAAYYLTNNYGSTLTICVSTIRLRSSP